MPWSIRDLAGHPCDVFLPSQRCPQNYVILYLHGVHEQSLADHAPFTDAFEQQGLVVVGPRTGRSWWSNRICPEFDSQMTAETYVLGPVLDYIASEFKTASPRIGLLGTSMGGQGVLRLSYRFPDRFPVVAAISPAIDYYLKMYDPDDDDPLLEMYEDPEDARQDTAILFIHPLNWPRHQFFCCDPSDRRWFDSADRLQMKLSSLGVMCEHDLETSAGGHGFAYYNHMAARTIDFIVNGLNSEQLRVV